MALNFKQQLKQLRAAPSRAMFHSPRNVRSLLVHMVLCGSDIRTAREEEERKRYCLSSLICRLPRGVLTNQADSPGYA